MAHENCIGRWEQSKVGDVPEGNGIFIINAHNTELITGRHEGRGGLNILGKCDGTRIRFAVFNPVTGDVFCYVKGRITVSQGTAFINGKFRTPLEEADIDSTDKEMLVDGKRVLVAADDWTAQKPT